jgi:DNA-binding PadR family transcriptional regulator
MRNEQRKEVSVTPLTDLEGAALAEIESRGSTTSYVVAQTFARSPSEFWSGSAGAVYPLVKRLAARKLLEATAAATGKRARIDYRVTAAGRAALEDWLLDAQRAAGLGFDPLRTRLGHLHLVAPERRAAFLQQVRALTAETARRPAFVGQPTMMRIHQSWLQARVRWLAMLDFVAK